MNTFKVYNHKSQLYTIGEGPNAYTLEKMVVGEKGRGRTHGDIVCSEAVKEGDIVEIGQTKTQKLKLIKKNPNTKFEGWIIRACASGAYTKNTRGYVTIKRGKPQILAEGYHAWGDAGNAGGFQDNIYACPFGTILYVHPASPSKGYEPFYIFVRQSGCVEVKESDVETFIDHQNIACEVKFQTYIYGTPKEAFATEEQANEYAKQQEGYDVAIKKTIVFI
jgi:hypothetical protein